MGYIGGYKKVNKMGSVAKKRVGGREKKKREGGGRVRKFLKWKIMKKDLKQNVKKCKYFPNFETIRLHCTY